MFIFLLICSYTKWKPYINAKIKFPKPASGEFNSGNGQMYTCSM
ncbi:hypothetical protein SAMN05444144_104278 [Flavobacterium akiainvivens]|nr:hypothetical protein SAMN05444144_104278 [Flavobacterium akiainvivens]